MISFFSAFHLQELAVRQMVLCTGVFLDKKPSSWWVSGQPAAPEHGATLKDVVDFGKAWSKTGAVVKGCISLQESTRWTVDAIGAWSEAFAFCHEAETFKSTLEGSEVCCFDHDEPTSAKVKLAVKIFHTMHHMPSGWKDLEMLWNGLTEQMQAEFQNLHSTMTASVQGVLHKMQSFILKADGGSIISDISKAQDMSQGDRQNQLYLIQHMIRKLKFLETPADSDELARVESLAEELKQLVDTELSQDERLVKNALVDAMQKMKAGFPVLTMNDIANASLDVLKAEVVVRSDLGEKASAFMMALKAAGKVARFGNHFAYDVAAARVQITRLLAIQSAFMTLDATDAATQAASFEEAKLKPRGITLADLPASVVNALSHASKQS